MSKPGDWVAAVADARGLKMTEARAAEVGEEAQRIGAGVATVAAAHFGFYDEPIQFLAALDQLAEDDA